MHKGKKNDRSLAAEKERAPKEGVFERRSKASGVEHVFMVGSG